MLFIDKNHVLTLLVLSIFCVSYVGADERAADCRHWPQQFSDYEGEYLIAYKGECKAGFAHGKGTLYTFEKWRRDDPYKIKASGFFNNGIYLGDKDYRGEFTIDRHRALTQLGESNGHPIWLHAHASNAKPLSLCKPSIINISVDDFQTHSTDDALSQATIRQAFKLYTTLCPDFDYDVLLAITTSENVLVDRSRSSEIHAVMNNTKDDFLLSYRNYITEDIAYQKQREEEERQRQEKIKTMNSNIMRFFQQSDVAELVEVNQLEKNPFLWEGKVVAIAVTLDKMLTRRAALLLSTNQLFNEGRVVVTGIKPKVFKSAGNIIAAKVVGQEQHQGTTHTTLSYIGHYMCESEQCLDITFAGLDDYIKP